MANTKRVRNNISADTAISAPTITADDLVVTDDASIGGDLAVTGNVSLAEPVVNEKEVKVKKISSPSSPASGYVSVYAKSDDALYYKNSGGAEKKIAQDAGPQVAVVQDLKADSTPGGDGSATTWNTRDLNSLLNPLSVSWISIGSNQITLSSGKYLIEGQCPISNANGPQIQHQARLRNITDSTTDLLGTSGNVDTAAGTSANDYSFIRGVISISASKVFEVQHWISATGGAGTDFGIFAASGAGEVYTQLKIQRLGD